MTVTVRLLAPAAAHPLASQTVRFPVSGVGAGLSDGATSSTPGQTLDADIGDVDRLTTAGGWLKIAMSGSTASRPSAGLQGNITSWADPGFKAGPGFPFWDTSLDELVVWDGAAWRTADGASV